MRRLTFEPARPIDTDQMPWIPTGPGKSFRPLHFAVSGWSELMRLQPGSAVAVHRHTGEVRDQAHLYGLLDRLRDYGIELVAVEPTSKADTGAEHSSPHGPAA